VLWASVLSVRALRSGLLLVLAGLVFTAIDPVWRIDPDAAAYLTLARSVASGAGYLIDGLPHAKYPPGLPLLLAGLVQIGGPEAYGLFQGALAAAWMASVLASHRLARHLGVAALPAFCLAAGVGLSQTLFELSVRYLRSEALFLALSLAALLSLWSALGPGGRWRHVALAACLLVACIAVRLAGISLLAVPAWALLQPLAAGRRRAAGLLLGVGLAALAAWMAWGAHVRSEHPGAPDYSQEFLAAAPRDMTKVVQVDVPPLDAPALGRRVLGNVSVMARAHAVLLTNVDKAGARPPVGYALLGLMLLGAATLARGAAGVPPGVLALRRSALAYLAATLALYLVWPFDQQERFYVPLLPLLLLAAGAGVGWAAQRAGRLSATRHGRVLLLWLGAAAVLVLALQRSDDPRVLGRWSRAFAALLAVALAGLASLPWLLRRWLREGAGRLPAGAPLLLPLLFLVPFLHLRFSEWPAQVSAFAERRARAPLDGPLARIDVHPALEQVALYLRDEVPPDVLLMTDVPKMLSVLSGRRCVPFVFRASPPEVLLGSADLLFYTGEIPEAAAVVQACAEQFEPVLHLDDVEGAGGGLPAAVLRPR